MDVHSLSTDCLPQADRFTWWHDMTVSMLLPTLLRSEHAADFRAAAQVLDLGPVRITAMSYPPLFSTRTPGLIRQSDPECWQVSLTVRGRMGLAQAGREVTVGPGDLLLYDSSRPFEGWTAAAATATGSGSLRHIVAQIPKSALPLHPPLLTPLLGERLPAGQGFGALLAHFLTHVTDRPDAYRASDRDRLSGILLDLLGGTVSHCLETSGALPAESRRHALFLQIQEFVTAHLADPGLCADTIAAAHHISVRTLHRLFQQHGTSVRAHVRALRLDGCRRELADPLHRHRPIHAVAARWGFRRPADFTRAFRTAYGVPPRDYRRTALKHSAAC